MNDNNFYEDEKNELLNLLNLDESDWLEFKQCYDKKQFMYYVISLCNSLANKKERYIIYGVSDKKNKNNERDIIGLDDSIIKKNLNRGKLSYMLKNNGINPPYINVYNIKKDNKIISVVELIPSITDLPYYSTVFIDDPDKEKKDNKKEDNNKEEKNKKNRDIKPKLIYSRDKNGNCELADIDKIKEIFNLKQNSFSLKDFLDVIRDKESWEKEFSYKNYYNGQVVKNIEDNFFYKKNLNFQIKSISNVEVLEPRIASFRNEFIQEKNLENDINRLAIELYYKNIIVDSYEIYEIPIIDKKKIGLDPILFYFPLYYYDDIDDKITKKKYINKIKRKEEYSICELLYTLSYKNKSYIEKNKTNDLIFNYLNYDDILNYKLLLI